MLQNKQKIGKRINTFAKTLVDEMRHISPIIPMNDLRTVVQQAVNKYSTSFLEKDAAGNIISSTMVPLLTIMSNRVNFLNRAPKRNTQFDPDIPIKNKRRSNLFKNTCVNWQPTSMNSSETLSSLNMETIKKFMTECYDLQRTHFNTMNQVPTIRSIKTEWPLIFKKAYLYDHFKKLMNLDASLFEINVNAELGKIRRHFENLNKPKFYEALSQGATDYEILNAIALYFGKNIGFLHKNFEIETTLEEILCQISTNAPFMAIVQIQNVKKINCNEIARKCSNTINNL
ncbi:hypothetical protein FF38_00731 [Lucilia cuprina]|uniref:Uncharacterized protein n=1 Tax=Lucilia cuprina TaxID=7375 RepID=A0A0L0CPY7_LUCCU|nr:hypothetical protein FF38_00731 [Lucilia cuprina]